MDNAGHAHDTEASLVPFIRSLRAETLVPAGVHVLFANGTGTASQHPHLICNVFDVCLHKLSD